MRVNVFLNSYQQRFFIGILEQENNHIFFEYAPQFLAKNISLSPFMLPLQEGVFEEKNRTFDGLFGLFNDSLPDGWGCLILDRYLQKQGLSYYSITPLHRLSLIGNQAMGALEYAPEQLPDEDWVDDLHLDNLSLAAHEILQGESSALLDHLRSLNGSTCGARPKIVALVSSDYSSIISGRIARPDYDPWIIKFSSDTDDKNLGAVEYIYSLMAKKAGLEMPDTFLFPSKTCAGHFGTKRFDRDGINKVHIHSACGLLHASHRLPTLDYENLIRLTSHLTKDSREVEKMVRLMIFNVKVGNKDDHSKNFSFYMDENFVWKFAPAYDITPSSGINGEHTAMVNGKGRDIQNSDLIKAAQLSGLSNNKIKEMIEEVEDVVSYYPLYLKEYGIKTTLGPHSF